MHWALLANVENAREVGNAILDRMKGIAVAHYTFKKSYQEITNVHKGVTVKIDLFQQLTVASNATNRIEDLFKYAWALQLSTSTVFDSSLMLRQPQKTTLHG